MFDPFILADFARRKRTNRGGDGFTQLVPRLRLGTHCLAGSACRGTQRSEGGVIVREAEPRKQCVPRQSLGTSCKRFNRLSAAPRSARARNVQCREPCHSDPTAPSPAAGSAF